MNFLSNSRLAESDSTRASKQSMTFFNLGNVFCVCLYGMSRKTKCFASIKCDVTSIFSKHLSTIATHTRSKTSIFVSAIFYPCGCQSVVSRTGRVSQPFQQLCSLCEYCLALDIFEHFRTNSMPTAIYSDADEAKISASSNNCPIDSNQYKLFSFARLMFREPSIVV